MSLTLAAPIVNQEQKLLLPGNYNWSEFVALEKCLRLTSNLRLSYLDGWIEIMTLSETHEQIKSLIGMFLEAYFIAMEIEFIPVGSATRRSEEQGISFEPDESYYLGTKKLNPDLAIEVVLTSGSLQKLEKYRRFQIQEVWFWENGEFTVYALNNNTYRLITNSQLLPELDLLLLTHCLQIPSRIEAMKVFIAGLKSARNP